MSRRKWIDVVEAYQNLPDHIPSYRLEELVMRLRRRDRSVEHEIIRGHLRLGLSIIQDIGNADPEDLVGEMEMAVTEAVWRAGRGFLRDNNITPYIASYVKYRVNDYIKSNRLVSAPVRTVRYWNNKNKKQKLFNRIRIVEGEPYKFDDSNEAIRLQSKGVAYHIPKVDDSALDDIDIRELLNKITFSKSEKRIVELREQGFGLEEIGHIVGYSKSAVHKILHQIEDRFDNYMKDAK